MDHVSTEKLNQEFVDLLHEEGNGRCADCDEAAPRWISLSFGIFICLNCAGHHRSLGTHITSVRSIELDEFQPAYIDVLRLGGNRRFSEYLHSLVEPSSPMSSSSKSDRDVVLSKLKKYGVPEVLYYSELLKARLEQRDPIPFDPIKWTALIRSPDSSISSKAVAVWVNDHASDKCMLCGGVFTLLTNRKHHCRRCGKLVCGECAPSNNCRPILEWGLKDAVRHCRDCYRSPAIDWSKAKV